MLARTILIPTGPGLDTRPRLDAAFLLARDGNAHVNVVFFNPDPAQVLASLRGLAMAVDATLAKLHSDTGAAFAATQASFDAWCAERAVKRLTPSDHDHDGLSGSFTKRVGDVETMLAVEARLNDLIILERPDDPNRFQSQAFDAAVFSSGRLSMIVPRAFRRPISANMC